MASLKLFLTNLATKAGFDVASNQAYFDALPETEVPVEVIAGIDNSLISLRDAKNNHSEIASVYRKQVFDGLDKTNLALFDELEIPDDLRAEFAAEASPFKRQALIARKVAELKSAKSASGSSTDKAAFQKQIDDLQAALRAEKENTGKAKTDYEKELQTFKTKYKLNELIAGHKTIHDELDPSMRSMILDQIITKNLQDNQAQLVFNEQGELSLQKTDGSTYYGENNLPVTPAQFIEQTLAKNKQLKVSTGPTANPSRSNPQRQAGGGDDKPNPQTRVVDHNRQALEDIKAAAAL